MSNEIDDFLNYCEGDSVPIPEQKTEETTYSFDVKKYVFLVKNEFIAMFSLLKSNNMPTAIGAILQVDIRKELPQGNIYKTFEEAEEDLALILNRSVDNGWTIGWRGLRNLG